MAKLRDLRDMPIGRKLLALSAAVTALMLLSLTTVSALKEVHDWRTGTTEQLATVSRVIGANAAPALLFNDPRSAADTLAGLSATPNIISAAIYDQTGARFAAYGDRQATPARLAGRSPLAARRTLTQSSVTEVAPITFQGQRVGTLYLQSDVRELYEELLSGMGALLLTSLASFGLYTLILSRVQRGIVAPIEDLTRTMERVSRTGDYGARVLPASRDEVGVLAHSFNSMLTAVQDRDVKLAQHQTLLEGTVRQRTGELRDANVKLERELTERRIAQEALHAHDAMMKAVARSAAELLGSLSLEAAIARVLELIGQTLFVGRVQLGPVANGPDGHLRRHVQQEWCAPGLEALRGEPAFQDLDLTANLPRLASAAVVGDRSVLTLPDVPPPLRSTLERAGVTSLLFVPIMIEGRLWGGLTFMDSGPQARAWGWAETDTLTTLAGLMGVALARAHYLQELADANTIVQNSPTVLYRLKGDPQLQLTYISHNVTKFGYDPRALVASKDFLAQIVHPDDRPKVAEAMTKMMERNAARATVEFRLGLPSGGFRWVENRYTLVRDEMGRLVEIEGIIIDITERKAADEKIARLARTDSLTGLANRATFLERLHQAFAGSQRGAHPFAVLYLDVDHFKDVNDTRGHPVGDRLLQEVAERLRDRVRDTDLVARLGGDEFAVLQSEVTDPADAGALGADIVESLSAPYLIDGAELRVTASVGVAPLTPSATNPDVMLSQADRALYRAKEDGRNQYRFHSEDLDRQVSERIAIAGELRTAMAEGQLYLEYQPQVELLSGRIVGMEALVRWRHPTRGVLRPADFLPTAEASDAMEAFGSWVLDHACAQMRVWRKTGVAPRVIAVDVSMRQLKSGPRFVALVTDILARHGLPPSALELDVTESMLAKATLAQNDVLEQLVDLGVRLALDDFGQEYSTFDYLRAYPVNHLKLARRFIEKACRDKTQAATVRALLGVGRDLGIKVIAEGVEDDEQRGLLLSIGRSAPGRELRFSEPVAPERATELLRQGMVTPAAEPAR